MQYAQGKQKHLNTTSYDDTALIVLKRKAKTLNKEELNLWLGDEKIKLGKIAAKEYERYGRLTTEKCLYQSKKVDMLLNMI